MDNSTTYQIEIPASTSNLADVRKFVGVHATGFGFKENEVEEIKLAVDEALTNVIKHAYKFDDSKTIYISVGLQGREFWVAIQDTGAPFEPQNYTEPNIPERVKKGLKGGVGVYLIKRLVDKVEYNKKSQHNEIKLIKKL